jgi:hypothetical protein
MSSPNDDRPKLTPEDQEFVERVAASYAPPPMAAAERAAFDEALFGRVRRKHATRRWLTLAWLPAAAAAGLAAVWLFSGWPGSEGPAPSQEIAPALSARAWEEELFLDTGLFESEQPDDSELLPEEYLAIASTFLDG